MLVNLPFILFGQMKVKGKLTDISKASKQQVLNSISGEFSDDVGDEKYSIKIDKQGNFKMYYAITTPAGHSSTGYWGKGGWTLRISGKANLIPADVTRVEEQRDKYGDITKVGFYTKYYVVFKGNDEKGRGHSFCAEIYQKFDNKYMYGWQMSHSQSVPAEYCESTNDPQTARVGYLIDLN
jgi:hypothetical protein